MRYLRVVVLAGLGFKVAVLGLWWWNAAAAYAAGEAGSEAAVPSELFTRSRGFRELLEAVSARGAELDRREEAIAARESALRALERTIADQVVRLEHLTDPTAAAEPVSGEPAAAPRPADGRVAITDIYEKMRAEEAAAIIDRLDEQTARRILARMKEKQIAAILAAMETERAVALTKALAASGAPPVAR
jgi:flagellar motility protein MotE (MotC chaperone)